VFAQSIAFFTTHRRRFARLVLASGVVFAALKLWPNWPRELDVEYRLGADHSQIVEFRVAYLQGSQELQGVRFSFPEGAPHAVRHRLTLPAGTFVLRCELRDRAGTARAITRRLHTPIEGAIRIFLDEPTAPSANRPVLRFRSQFRAMAPGFGFAASTTHGAT
jgi:hypothetical protein